MSIFEIADIIDAQIVIRRYPNQNERWICHFDGAEIKEGQLLKGSYGSAKSVPAAITEYCKAIEGKEIVFHAMSNELRRQFKVPPSITQ